MSGKRWTEEEIRWIDENRAFRTPEDMARILKRSRMSVWTLMSKYGMKSYKSASDMLALSHIYQIIGVAPDTIKRKWASKGLKIRDMGAMHMVDQKDLLSYMRKHTEDWEYSRIKSETIFTDQKWYWKNKPKADKPDYHWQPQDVDTLVRMYTRGCRAKDIAQTLGRTEGAVRTKLLRLRQKKILYGKGV